MSMTIGGKPAFAPWAENPAVQFGQALIRLAMASRAVGEHDARMRQMDDWLEANAKHPLWPERWRKRETARSAATRLRNNEHRQLEAACDFLRQHCPDIRDQWQALWSLLSQFGGQWPADPSHKGDPIRRLDWSQLGGIEPAPEPIDEPPY